MTKRHSAGQLRALRLGPIVTFLVLLGASACQGHAGTPRHPTRTSHTQGKAPHPASRRPRMQAAVGDTPIAVVIPKALYHVRTGVKAVALTYDDGPGPGKQSTPGVLAVLAAHHAHATFFVIGQEAERFPDLVREERAQGMEVENHGYRHVNLAALSEAGQTTQIEKGASAIRSAGGPAPAYLRPPFGSQNARLRQVADRLGERVVIWTIDPRDWSNPGTGYITTFVLNHVEPGAIILLHDGGGKRAQTVEATRVIVPDLEKQGYRLVTLRELTRLEGKGLQAPIGPGSNPSGGSKSNGPGSGSGTAGSGPSA